MEYFVLKGHDTTGPFSEEDLRQAFAGQRLSATDLVRPSDERHYTPLRKLLDRLDTANVPAPAPRKSSVVGVGGWVPVPGPKRTSSGLWEWINANPLRAGLAGVALASSLAFLSRWPLLVALPGLVLGVTAGFKLILRHRPVWGGIISLAATLLPIALAPGPKAPAPATHEIAASAPVAPNPVEAPKPPSLTASTAPVPSVDVPVEAPRAAEPAASAAVVLPELPPVVEKSAPASNAPPTPAPARSGPGKIMAAIVEKLTPAPSAPPTPPSTPAEPDKIAAVGAPGSPALPPLPAVVPSPGSAQPARPEDLVFLIDTGTGRGTGFLAAAQGRVYFYTNLHVVSGAKKINARSTLATFDFKDGNVEIAADRDLVRFPVPTQPALQFGETPMVDDAVVALGNSGGRDVVTRLEGKVLGVGPAQIEVTSEFIPGNSGGPLIGKDNRVLGIATYLVHGENVADWIKAGTRFATTRRFGVRATDDVKWEVLPVVTMLRQTTLQHTGEKVFSDYIAVIKTIAERPFGQPISTALSERSEMRFFVEDYNRTCRDLSTRTRNINRADYNARLRDNLGKLSRSLRSTAQGFRRDLGTISKGYMKEQETELLEAYDKLATAIEKNERDLFHL